MGNIFTLLKPRNRSIGSRISSNISTSASANRRYPTMSKQPSSVSVSSASSTAAGGTPKENKMKKKYTFIPDNFSSLEQVCFLVIFKIFVFLMVILLEKF